MISTKKMTSHTKPASEKIQISFEP